MKRPAVFFDRDNTLIACDEYLGEPQKVVLTTGAAGAVARARKLGYAVVTVSNQSGVARGYFAEEAVHAVNQKLDDLLRDGNPKAVIDRHEFCPFHPDASIEKYRQDSPLRKPAPGMLLQAAEALALDLTRSWMIGDAPRDVEAGRAAGCRTILFTDPTLKSSPAASVEQKTQPDYVCSTLAEALDFIEKHTDAAQSVEAEDAHKDASAEASEPIIQEKMRIVEAAPAREAARIEEISVPIAAEPERKTTKSVEAIANEILQELRRHHEQPVTDFSVSKLMAGVVQVIVLFVLFLAFLDRNDARAIMPLLTFALTLQTMTIALLIMSRQK